MDVQGSKDVINKFWKNHFWVKIYDFGHNVEKTDSLKDNFNFQDYYLQI